MVWAADVRMVLYRRLHVYVLFRFRSCWRRNLSICFSLTGDGWEIGIGHVGAVGRHSDRKVMRHRDGRRKGFTTESHWGGIVRCVVAVASQLVRIRLCSQEIARNKLSLCGWDPDSPLLLRGSGWLGNASPVP